METRDLILRAARLLSPPRALSGDSVLLRGGRIVAIGALDELERQAPTAEILDLGRASLLPGFIDSHTHFFEWARRLAGLDLGGANNLSELRRRLHQYRSRVPASDDWIGGGGWDPALLGVDPRLDRALLDEFFPDRPVALESRDFHTLWCNTRALELAGVFAGIACPNGGEIGVGADGQPDGLLYETAWQLILDARPPEREALRAEWLRHAIARAHALGITGFHSMEPEEARRSYRHLADRGELDMRVVYHSPLLRLSERLEMDAPSYRADDEWLRWGGVKIFMDGSLGSHSAYMIDAYPDGQCGRLLMSGEELREHVIRAARGGIAPSIHAIGDACVRTVVDALEAAQLILTKEGGRIPPGCRIEHAQCVRPEEIPRIAALGVLCTMQPIHLSDDVLLLPRLWPSAGRYAYPTRSLLQGGVPIALGSDVPVADPDPRQGIYAAIERRAGNLPGGVSWHPEQALLPPEALAGYTVWAAQAGLWQDELGAIALGRMADFVAMELPEDGAPSEEWLEARLRLTMVAGRVCYEDLE